jgi:hypothetical protein
LSWRNCPWCHECWFWAVLGAECKVGDGHRGWIVGVVLLVPFAIAVAIIVVGVIADVGAKAVLAAAAQTKTLLLGEIAEDVGYFCPNPRKVR